MSAQSLFDGSAGRAHQRAHDTEIAAAESQRPKLGRLRRRVLEEFQRAGENGRTDYEVGTALGIFRHSAATRREELMARGFPIVKTDARRPTDTGRPAIVWVLR